MPGQTLSDNKELRGETAEKIVLARAVPYEELKSWTLKDKQEQ